MCGGGVADNEYKVYMTIFLFRLMLTTRITYHSLSFTFLVDPKHPNCLRIIKVEGTEAKISGTDGNPGCPADGAGKEWNLLGKVEGDEILVDFTPKGGPKDLKGVFDGTGIKWPDGNKWALKTN